MLARIAKGDQQAVDALLPLVYEELRGLAEGQLRKERAGHTLQTTALVHEAYLQLVGNTPSEWKDRPHFLAIAARAMRQVLVNHALAKKASKRGGGRQRIALDEALEHFEQRSIDLLALHEALKRLSELDPQHGELVELRFFGGVTMEEIAQMRNQPLRTLERQWNLARAWLRREVDRA